MPVRVKGTDHGLRVFATCVYCDDAEFEILGSENGPHAPRCPRCNALLNQPTLVAAAYGEIARINQVNEQLRRQWWRRAVGVVVSLVEGMGRFVGRWGRG